MTGKLMNSDDMMNELRDAHDRLYIGQRVRVDESAAAALARELEGNISLTSLQFLGGNELGSECCRIIAESLKRNTVLRSLGLAGNWAGVEGCAALAESLKVNETLTELNLSSNGLGDEGCEILAEMLKYNTALTDLKISRNAISAAGYQKLVDGFKHNKTLAHLKLTGSQICVLGCKALAEIFRLGRLRSMNMSGAHGEEHLPDSCERMPDANFVSQYTRKACLFL